VPAWAWRVSVWGRGHGRPPWCRPAACPEGGLERGGLERVGHHGRCLPPPFLFPLPPDLLIRRAPADGAPASAATPCLLAATPAARLKYSLLSSCAGSLVLSSGRFTSRPSYLLFPSHFVKKRHVALASKKLHQAWLCECGCRSGLKLGVGEKKNFTNGYAHPVQNSHSTNIH
jgi:hypothetical protein